MRNQLTLSVFILLVSGLVCYGQPEDSKTINQQFDEVIENTETFKQYKVVPRTMLKELSGQVNDTLAQNRTEILVLKNEIGKQETRISELESQLQTVTDDLEKSNSLNDSIALRVSLSSGFALKATIMSHLLKDALVL